MRITYQIVDNHIFRVDPNYTPTGDENPMNLTVKQLILNDIAAGTNKTGYREYLKVFEYHGILKPLEVAEWRAKLPMVEKDLPSLSV